MYKKLVLVNDTVYKIGDTFFLDGTRYEVWIIKIRDSGSFDVYATSKTGESAWIHVPATSVICAFGKYTPPTDEL